MGDKILCSIKDKTIRLLHRIHVFFAVKSVRRKIGKLTNGGKISLVARIQHLGDIIAAEPLSRMIRSEEGFVIWLVRKEYAELVEENPNIDNVIIIHSLCELQKLSPTNDSYHFYDLHFQGETCHVCGAVYQARQGKVSTADYYFHENLLQGFLLAANIEYKDLRPQIYFTKVLSADLPSKFIIIHREAQNHERMWDDQKWSQFISAFLNDFPDYYLFEIGLRSKERFSNSRYRNYSGKLKISASTYLISKCRLFIGIDSGPAHIAHALRVPSIILLGRFANFIHYCPYSGLKECGETTHIIDYSPALCFDIPVEEVLSTVQRQLHS